MAEIARDPRIDAYIESLPAWQQRISRTVRALVHAADPEVLETIKRTDRPYFVLQGNICALLAAKGHVKVFLYGPPCPRSQRHHHLGSREQDGTDDRDPPG
jgi:hypothetical protein